MCRYIQLLSDVIFFLIVKTKTILHIENTAAVTERSYTEAAQFISLLITSNLCQQVVIISSYYLNYL